MGSKGLRRRRPSRDGEDRPDGTSAASQKTSARTPDREVAQSRQLFPSLEAMKRVARALQQETNIAYASALELVATKLGGFGEYRQAVALLPSGRSGEK